MAGAGDGPTAKRGTCANEVFRHIGIQTDEDLTILDAMDVLAHTSEIHKATSEKEVIQRDLNAALSMLGEVEDANRILRREIVKNEDYYNRELEAMYAEIKRQRAVYVRKDEEIQGLQKKIKDLQDDNKRLKERRQMKLTVQQVKSCKIKGLLTYYTGFAYITFMKILSVLFPAGSDGRAMVWPKKVRAAKAMKLEDQFLLVMMRLRRAAHFKDLSFRFGLSAQDAANVFNTWINFMYFQLSSIPIWPHRDRVIEEMPSKYKEMFPTTIAIMDCTELKIQKPSDLTVQSQTYSEYKGTNTLKGLVICDPRGCVMYVSPLYGGAISDKQITEQCGLLEILQRHLDLGFLHVGDGLMADKGFLVEDAISNLGLRLNVPPRVAAKSQMTDNEVETTKGIARHRVHVERVIARIKNFKILTHRLDISVLARVDHIWYVCAMLSNLQPYLVKKD